MNKTALPSCDEEYEMPPTEALLAGTLALMTGCAQHGGPVCHRELMVGKVVSNLTQLAQHPALSAPMRTLLGRLSARWLLELGAVPSVPGMPPLPEHQTLQ